MQYVEITSKECDPVVYLSVGINTYTGNRFDKEVNFNYYLLKNKVKTRKKLF